MPTGKHYKYFTRGNEGQTFGSRLRANTSLTTETWEESEENIYDALQIACLSQQCLCLNSTHYHSQQTEKVDNVQSSVCVCVQCALTDIFFR